MEKHEIETELNEVERDLADIARRAHIAASNLRSVVEFERRMPLPAYVQDIERIKFNAELTRTALAKTRAIYRDAPAPASEASCAQGASLASETKSEDTKKGEIEQ